MKFLLIIPLIVALVLLSGFGSVEGKISRKTKKHSVEKKVSDNVKAKASNSTIQEAYEGTVARWMDPTNRALGTTTMPHTTKYDTIIGQEDNVFVPGFTEVDNSPNALLGSIRYTSGGIHRQTDIQSRVRTAPNGQLYSGNLQAIKFPSARTNFFATGECTTTQVEDKNTIIGHSCLYSICLGGGGNNCVNGLAAGPFRYQLGEMETKMQPNGKEITYPKLPPTFSGIILGGTGACAGIKGTFKVLTISGQTSPLIEPQFGLIHQRFIFNTNKKLPEAPQPRLAISNLAGQVTLRPTTTPSASTSFSALWSSDITNDDIAKQYSIVFEATVARRLLQELPDSMNNQQERALADTAEFLVNVTDRTKNCLNPPPSFRCVLVIITFFTSPSSGVNPEDVIGIVSEAVVNGNVDAQLVSKGFSANSVSCETDTDCTGSVQTCSAGVCVKETSEAPVSPTAAPVVPTAAPVVPTAAPVSPTAAPVSPTAAPVSPTAAPVVPTAAPVSPTAAPVSPTAAPVSPTAAPVSPTAAPVSPTAAPISPTVAPVVPTTAPISPTAAPVSPTAAPVSPTAAPVGPTVGPAVCPSGEDLTCPEGSFCTFGNLGDGCFPCSNIANIGVCIASGISDLAKVECKKCFDESPSEKPSEKPSAAPVAPTAAFVAVCPSGEDLTCPEGSFCTFGNLGDGCFPCSNIANIGVCIASGISDLAKVECKKCFDDL